jgi:hypothetical protein
VKWPYNLQPQMPVNYASRTSPQRLGEARGFTEMRSPQAEAESWRVALATSHGCDPFSVSLEQPNESA